MTAVQSVFSEMFWLFWFKWWQSCEKGLLFNTDLRMFIQNVFCHKCFQYKTTPFILDLKTSVNINMYSLFSLQWHFMDFELERGSAHRCIFAVSHIEIFPSLHLWGPPTLCFVQQVSHVHYTLLLMPSATPIPGLQLLIIRTWWTRATCSQHVKLKRLRPRCQLNSHPDMWSPHSTERRKRKLGKPSQAHATCLLYSRCLLYFL